MPRGRPILPTPALQRNICRFLAGGNFCRTACGAAGLDERTFREWMDRGAREPAGLYYRFRTAVQAAQARAEAEMVATRGPNAPATSGPAGRSWRAATAAGRGVRTPGWRA